MLQNFGFFWLLFCFVLLFCNMERFISRGDDPKSATYILMQPKYDEKNEKTLISFHFVLFEYF